MLEKQPSLAEGGANFAAAFAAGRKRRQDAKLAELAAKQQDEKIAAEKAKESELSQLMDDARQKYDQGDREALLVASPDEYRAREDTRKETERRDANELRIMSRALASAGDNKEKQQAILGYAQRRGIDMTAFGKDKAGAEELAGPALPGQDRLMPQEDDAGAAAFDFETRASRVLGPEDPAKRPTPLSSAGKEAFDEQNFPELAGKIGEGKEAARMAASSEAEKSLRGEFMNSGMYRAAREINSNYQKISNTSETPAGDMSLIFGYMKLLDPSSAVKETEYAAAENATNVPDRVRNLYNMTKDGRKLTPEQRSQFKSEAEKLLGAHSREYGSYVKAYSDLAAQRGLKPENVVLFPTLRSIGAQAGGKGGQAARPFKATGAERASARSELDARYKAGELSQAQYDTASQVLDDTESGNE